jgi:glycosyltransferase involved in cell wall biosynthesis
VVQIPSIAPAITICIPTYNRSGWLCLAIESALAQTRCDFEQLVGDNASTDDTPAIVAAFGDSRIRYARRRENLGLVANYNLCLQAVTTPYLIVLPDDDLLRPAYLERTVPILERFPSVGMVHTAFDRIDEEGKVIVAGMDYVPELPGFAVEPGRQFLRRGMRAMGRVGAVTALVRRAALPPDGYLDADSPANDVGLWLRIAAGWDVAFLRQPLAAVRLHGDRVSGNVRERMGGGVAAYLRYQAHLRDVKIRAIERSRTADTRLADGPSLERTARRTFRAHAIRTVLYRAVRKHDPARAAAIAAAVRGIDRFAFIAPGGWLAALGRRLRPRSAKAGG